MNAMNNGFHTHTRPLGYIESFHHILNTNTGILRNVVVVIDLEKTINANFIITFLKIAHQHFSALRIKIINNDNVALFSTDVPFDAIPVSVTHDNVANSEDFLHKIEQEMNTFIDANHAMWRAKIIQATHKNTLLLTFHHSIFDGKSIIKLLKLFESFHFKKTAIPETRLYPPIEQTIHFKNVKLSGNSIDTDSKPWPVHQPYDIREQKSKCQLFEINPINVPQLKKLCHQNAISINHLLNAIAIESIATLYPNFNNLLLHTPIDLTKYSLGYRYRNEIGCFITILKSKLELCKNKSLFDIARNYANAFNQEFASLTLQNQFDYLQLKHHLTEKFKMQTTYFSGGIALSNIGEIKLKTPSFIKDVYFSTTLLGGLGIFVLSLLTLNSTMKITLSYTDPLLSQDFILSFIQLFKLRMASLMETV